MIPTASSYPTEFDSDSNLFLVHDALRASLVSDYEPGDTEITVSGDILILSNFPASGLITLTEQCSDPKERASSYYYASYDAATLTFSGLEILPGFEDKARPKDITHVTQNVMDSHHNNIKDAIISIQNFVGVKDTTDLIPFGETMEGRTNFLRNIVLSPKAWFSVDQRVGLVPFTVEFEDKSFRLGTDGTSQTVEFLWDFGDSTTSDTVGSVTKTYTEPGNYTVSLTITNDFGTDVCSFPALINARIPAPDEAVVKYTQGNGQTVTQGDPVNGPYTTPPRIRSPINTLIEFVIPPGENPNTPDRSFAGELLNSFDTPIDPVIAYNWALGDDLNHPNTSSTKASYSVGGIYDFKIRLDTEFGAYRITTYEDTIDIVENVNMWLWVFDDTTNIRSYEYGLISQTFKLNSNQLNTISRNSNFLNSAPDSDKQKQEFKRNMGFTARGNLQSGKGGTNLLYYASGRTALQLPSEETINMVEYNAFGDTYIQRDPISRPWNWFSFGSNSNVYFLLGSTSAAIAPNVSPTNLVKQTVNQLTFTVTSETWTDANFLNGATDLKNNPAVYDGSGDSVYGHYSVYRSTWSDNVGFMARNDNVGAFFRIRSFYRTEGSSALPFQSLRKMQDIQGVAKLEGQLTSLADGTYFFNNSGSLSKFDDTTKLWTTGGPGVNSAAYRALQDTTVDNFDSPENTLLIASDLDKRAYLSFDYSATKGLIKFNSVDLSFSALGSRPEGEQFSMGVY